MARKPSRPKSSRNGRLRAGGALPRPAFAIDAREVARWGAPFATVDLGVMVDFGD